MRRSLGLIALLLPVAHMAVLHGSATFGEPFSINVGPGNSVVRRVHGDDGKPELIHVGKDYFEREDGTKLEQGKVFLHKNGTLEFKSFGASDVATYTLPDEKPNVKTHPDGSKSMVGPQTIVLFGKPKGE